MRPLSERVQISTRACHWLHAQGCQEKSIKLGFSSPMIEVDKPPRALQDRAVEIKEIVGNQVRITWAANREGCLIIWRSLTLRKM